MGKSVLIAEDVLKELKDGKQLLYDTIDGSLATIKLTKEELKEYKEKLKGYPDFVIEREANLYHIRKKLNMVTTEANLHAQLDQAIAFLEDVLFNANKPKDEAAKPKA
jgi:hypothetical protein